MKVAILSWDYTGQVYPIRLLSTILESIGCSVKIVLATSYLESLNELNQVTFVDSKVTGFLEVISDCDIIGLSFLSIHCQSAKFMANEIKGRYPEKIIISGGIHASVNTKEVLSFSDYVCIGEGEIAIKRFIEKLMKRQQIELEEEVSLGIYSSKNSIDDYRGAQYIKNLDELPVPKFFFNSTYIYIPSKRQWELRKPEMFIPLNKNGVSRFSYYLFPDRGCYGKCTYCCRPLIKKLTNCYKVRRRSIKSIICELAHAKQRVKNMQRVFIYSDDFMFWPLDDLKKFINIYKRKIDLPFSFLCSPLSYDSDKIEVLLESGLVANIGMGIQTGSTRIRKLFNRKEKNNQILDVTKRLVEVGKKYKVTPAFDFIIDTPWEDDNDRIETLTLINSIQKPYDINLFSLTFYPGTELYYRAQNEGYIDGNQFNASVYEDRKKRYNRYESKVFANLCELVSIVECPLFIIKFIFNNKLVIPSIIIELLKINKNNTTWDTVVISTKTVIKKFLPSGLREHA